MFITEKRLKVIIRDVLFGKEDETINGIKRELEELKVKKVMEEREIKHLVRLKEEFLEITYKKKELELKDSFKDKEMKLQTEYHDKVMVKLEQAAKEMKEVYTKIMERLPNINMEITKKL